MTHPENRSRPEPGAPMGTLLKTSQPLVADVVCFQSNQGTNGSHWDDPSNAHPTLNQSFNTGAIGYSNQEIFSQRGGGLVADQATAERLVVQAMRESGPGWWTETTVAGTLDANMGASGHANRVATIAVAAQGRDGLGVGAVAFKPSHFTRGKDGAPSDIAPPLSADADKGDQDSLILSPRMQVRRLTPTECERLQGFPDGYTNIPMPTKRRAQKKRETDEEYAAYLASVPDKRAADGPRYKALGNSMAVPVMRWIGERVQMVEEKFEKGTEK